MFSYIHPVQDRDCFISKPPMVVKGGTESHTGTLTLLSHRNLTRAFKS